MTTTLQQSAAFFVLVLFAGCETKPKRILEAMTVYYKHCEELPPIQSEEQEGVD